MDISRALPENAVHVWYIPLGADLDRDTTQQYLGLLTAEEKARHNRFAQAKDRLQFLTGKMLVRTVLSRYMNVAPADWRFIANAHGKPMLAGSPVEPPPQFNLAHTEGLVACAVSRSFEVGIDVENVGRKVDLDVARRFFAPAEVAYLEGLAEGKWQKAFFLYWTLKEAYVKARGTGLTIPLEQFAFHLDDLKAPRVSFERALNDDAAQWQFFLPDVASHRHQVALAARRVTPAQGSSARAGEKALVEVRHLHSWNGGA